MPLDPNKQNEGLSSFQAPKVYWSIRRASTDPSAASLVERSPAGNIWQRAMLQAKALEEKIVDLATDSYRYTKRDYNTLGIPTKTFRYLGADQSNSTLEGFRQKALTDSAMRVSQAMTAGESLEGNYVVTDESVLKSMGIGAKPGDVYDIRNAMGTDGARYTFRKRTGNRGSWSDAILGTKSVTLNADQALDAFKGLNPINLPPKRLLKGIKVQNLLMAHETVVDRLLGTDSFSGVLSDPDKFKKLISMGWHHSSLYKGLNPREAKLMRTVTQAFAQHDNRLLSLHNTFESSFRTTWSDFGGVIRGSKRNPGIASRMGMTPEQLMPIYRRFAWRRTMESMVEGLTTQVRLPFATDFAGQTGLAFRGDFIFNRKNDRGESIFGTAFRTHEDLMKLTAPGVNWKGEPNSLSFMKGIVENYAVEGAGGNVLDLAAPDNYNAFRTIKSHLTLLDERERATMRGFRQGNMLVSNRATAFEQAAHSLQNMIKDEGLAGKVDLTYRWQQADPMLGTGFGVHFNISEKGAGGVTANIPGKQAQFFWDIEDTRGISVTQGGSTLINRWMMVNDTVLRDAKQFGRFRTDLGLITQGLWRQSIHALAPKGSGKKYFADEGAYGYQAAMSRVFGGGQWHAFSAAEVKSGFLTMESKNIVQAIKQGIETGDVNAWKRAGFLGQYAIGRAIGSDEAGVSNPIDLHTQDAARIRQSLFMSETGILPPHMFSATDSSLINKGRFQQALFDPEDITFSYEQRAQLLSNIGRLPKELEAHRTNVLKALRGEEGPISAAGLKQMAESSQIDELTASVIGTFGSSQGHKAKILDALRKSAANAVGALWIGSGPAQYTTKAWPELYQETVPLGWQYARPVQGFKTLDISKRGTRISEANLLYVDSEQGREFASKYAQRNVGVGVVMEGQEKELVNGEWVDKGQKIGGNEMMQLMGNYEQQGLVTSEAEEAFGARKGALQYLKFMAGTSKFTGVYAKDVEWGTADELGKITRDKNIQMILGVPFDKYVVKHESIRDVIRGWLGVIQTQTNPLHMQAMKSSLNQIFADHNLDLSFDISKGGGYLQGVAKRGGHFLETKEQALDILTRIHGLAQEEGLNLFGTKMVRKGNRYFEVSMANMVAPVRVIDDYNPGWQHKLNPLYSSKLLNRNRSDIGIQARDLMRMYGEGLDELPDMLRNNLVESNSFAKTAYLFHTHAQAFYGTTLSQVNDVAGAPIHHTAYTEDELGLRDGVVGRGGMTREEYLAKYGEGTRSYELSTGNTMYVPGEVPKAEKGGIYEASKVQKAADDVIAQDRAIRGLEGDAQTDARMRLNESFGRYKTALQGELAGKKGLVDKLSKRLRFDGPGFMKAPLQQDLEFEKAGPLFSVRVSEDYARQIGVYDRVQAGVTHGPIRAPIHEWQEATLADGSSLLQGDEYGKYFWASIHRDPNVISGRMGVKVYVDKGLTGYAAHVHESIREALMGDSDGDKIRMILAGMLQGAKLKPEVYQRMTHWFGLEHAAKSARYIEGQAIEESLRDPVGPRTTTGEGFINWLKNNPKLKFSTDAEIAVSHSVDAAQGLVGASTDLVQEAFLDLAVRSQGSPQEIAKFTQLYSAAGLIREIFLKVKAKGEYDPYEFEELFKGKAGHTLHGIALDAEGKIDLDAIAGTSWSMSSRNPAIKDNAGLLAKSRAFQKHLGEYFVDPARKSALEGKEIWHYQNLRAFANYWTNQSKWYANLGPEARANMFHPGTDKPLGGFFDYLTKDVRAGALGRLTGWGAETMNAQEVVQGLGQVYNLMSGAIQAGGSPAEQSVSWLGGGDPIAERRLVPVDEQLRSRDEWHPPLDPREKGIPEGPGVIRAMKRESGEASGWVIHTGRLSEKPGTTVSGTTRALEIAPIPDTKWNSSIINPQTGKAFKDSKWMVTAWADISDEEWARVKDVYNKRHHETRIAHTMLKNPDVSEEVIRAAYTKTSTEEALAAATQVAEQVAGEKNIWERLKNVVKNPVAGGVIGGAALMDILLTGGLGAGGLLYFGSKGQKKDRQPELPTPQQARQSKVRVMSTDPGGSSNGYNVQVNGSTDQWDGNEGSWGGYLSQTFGSPVTMHVRDHRNQDQSQTMQQLKGR